MPPISVSILSSTRHHPNPTPTDQPLFGRNVVCLIIHPSPSSPNSSHNFPRSRILGEYTSIISNSIIDNCEASRVITPAGILTELSLLIWRPIGENPPHCIHERFILHPPSTGARPVFRRDHDLVTIGTNRTFSPSTAAGRGERRSKPPGFR
ncbi:unnamed protein product [Nezara viridula]|uniref:Uncharacterized protein n=1 Tax=Nezara viridula TaxID=85310 RepID=A0A9P0H4S9_NEZVI|nr:unnamed protein product [Nezara viridula]